MAHMYDDSQYDDFVHTGVARPNSRAFLPPCYKQPPVDSDPAVEPIEHSIPSSDLCNTPKWVRYPAPKHDEFVVDFNAYANWYFGKGHWVAEPYGDYTMSRRMPKTQKIEQGYHYYLFYGRKCLKDKTCIERWPPEPTFDDAQKQRLIEIENQIWDYRTKHEAEGWPFKWGGNRHVLGFLSDHNTKVGRYKNQPALSYVAGTDTAQAS